MKENKMEIFLLIPEEIDIILNALEMYKIVCKETGNTKVDKELIKKASKISENIKQQVLITMDGKKK